MLFSQSVCQFHGSYLPPPFSFDSSFYRWDRGVFLQGPQIKRFSRSKSRALWAQWFLFLLVSMRESICSPPTVPAVDTKNPSNTKKRLEATPKDRCSQRQKKQQPKNTVSVSRKCWRVFAPVPFLSFLFVLSFEVIYGSYYRSRTFSWVIFFQRIRKNRTQKIFENNNFLVFGVIV